MNGTLGIPLAQHYLQPIDAPNLSCAVLIPKVKNNTENKQAAMVGGNYMQSSGLILLLCVLSSVISQEMDLSMLGEPVWTRLRPGWSLTVNDQCLYEFIFQFEHDKNLPVGDGEFRDTCFFGEEPGDTLGYAADGKLYLETRQMWERFPEYVWATTGFNHLSIDWRPCGQMPRGYAIPQYDFSVS